MTSNSNNTDLQVTTVKEEEDDNNDGNNKKNEQEEEENLEILLTTFGGVDDDNDVNDFYADFVNEEEREANAAKERRLARKRRLLLDENTSNNVMEDSSNPTTNSNKTTTATAIATSVAITNTTTEIKIKVEEVETEVKDPPQPHVKNEDNGDDNNINKYDDKPTAMTIDNGSADNEDNDNVSESSDESDMFGSPSPSSSIGEEDQEKKNKKKKKKISNAAVRNNASNNGNGNNKRQDGFDDSEGYYKASIGEIMDLEVIGYNNNNDNNSIDNGIDNSSDNDNNNTLRLRVLGVIGKGVFSSVLKCSTTHQTTTTATTTTTNTRSDGIPTSITTMENDNTTDLPHEVAVKCIRSNETMTKAAINEMKFLIRLTRDKKCSGIVPLLLPSMNMNSNSNSDSNRSNSNALPPSIDFRGHTLLIFPYLPYNLRDVLQKFGKGIGLSLSAVSNYYQQLLSAALHLQKHCIIHCDIKPDNILVSNDFKQLLIADFGSAIEATTTMSTSSSTKGDDDDTTGGVSINEIITPYLVSRFYRSPEIILGLSNQITYGIDLWSLAVTAGELFLGKVLFNGSNNNDMLYVIMTNLGPFSSRIIRSHLLQSKKHPELIPAHFSQVQSNYVFRKETVDTVLDQAVHKEISLGSNFNKPSLQSRLLKARSPKDKRIDVMKFADLLSKCLVLDPSKRISVKSALKHDFFTTPSSS